MFNIVPPQDHWPADFERMADTLRHALGNAALRIDHIGSTAVSGLCAKDVIDIQVSVAALDVDVAGALLASGFVQHPAITQDHRPPGCEGPDSDWAKLYFREPRGWRRAHIHVRRSGSANQRYALLFRDYLRAHRQMAAAYGELKLRLAASLADIETYPVVKDPAVDLIYFAAEAWASQSGWLAP